MLIEFNRDKVEQAITQILISEILKISEQISSKIATTSIQWIALSLNRNSNNVYAGKDEFEEIKLDNNTYNNKNIFPKKDQTLLKNIEEMWAEGRSVFSSISSSQQDIVLITKKEIKLKIHSNEADKVFSRTCRHL